MKNLKIEPLPGIIYLKIEKPSAGALDISSRESAVEYAEVLAVGGLTDSQLKELKSFREYPIKKGDKVFVKSWGVDIVNHNDVKYHFVSVETNAILAVVK